MPSREIEEFAYYLSDAYSTWAYQGGWGPSIKMLRRRGFNDQQIEAIIRSKWTRWTADNKRSRRHPATSADLARFLDGIPNLQAEVEALTYEMFGE